MTNRIAGALSALAFLAAGSLAHAAEPAKPAGEPAAVKMEAPKPAPELEKLKWMSGDMSCESTMNMPSGPMKNKASWKGKWMLGNMWLGVTFKVQKSKTFPGFEGNGFVGWDATKKQYAFWGVDNMGGWINLRTPAVTDTGATFAGQMTMMDKMADAQFTFTSDAKTMGFKIMSGTQTMQEVSCKR